MDEKEFKKLRVADRLHDIKIKMLSKMVWLMPHPRDEDGNPKPLFRKADGTITTDWDEVKDE